MNRTQIYWLCQIVGWGVYAIFNTLLINNYVRLTPRANFGVMLYGALGILVTHAIRAYIRRTGLMSRPWRQLIPRALALIPLGAVLLTILIFIDWWLWTGQSMAGGAVSVRAITAGIVFNMSFLMALWIVIYTAVHVVWRNIAMREAQLQALEAQINPHFLFNALNSLRGLILEDPAAAQDAVTRLSQLMRYSLVQSRRPTVPLAEELEIVRAYLAIEKMRFEDRLQIEWSIDPGLDAVQLPPMSLQTLVENALKHGIAHLPAGGRVSIAAALSSSTLRLQVRNPGTLRDPSTASTATGLANVRQRLQILRGSLAQLTLTESRGTVTAEILLPIQ